MTNTQWGAQISEVQLKRYKARAKTVMRSEAKIDHAYEIAAAKLRNERAMHALGDQGRLRAPMPPSTASSVSCWA